MPYYTFELQDGERRVGDENHVWFASRDYALDHAHNVARELMTARERETRSWRLDIYEDGARVEEIRFARLDPTLAHLSPMLRTSVEEWSDTLRDFREAACSARETLRESRALIARSKGMPYLATEGGKPTIRTSPTEAPNGNRLSRRSPRAE